jgi:hypothetical protein
MELSIRPEPDERDAVVAAVAVLLARDPVPAPYRSAWRMRGIRENLNESEPGLEGEPGQDYACEAGLPRSSPGAKRA